WHRSVQTVPDPTRQDFAGGILESLDLVQVVVVELSKHRPHRAGKVGKVAHPAAAIVNRSDDVDRDTKGVAMKACTLVAGGNIWKAMRRLEGELLEELHRDRLPGTWLAHCDRPTLPVEQAAGCCDAAPVVWRVTERTGIPPTCPARNTVVPRRAARE